ncbi:hypothetical protein E4H04_10290 [Candidatus Bathyarchaeota archaeon]|nr:MAG: hypothetical protein E4H04_10290 [Candidatus Bathyarchaeota archaeon]
MIELSTIRDLVAIFGVIAGFSYYVLTVRANQRNQELALKAQEQATETRQLDIYMKWQQMQTNLEWMKSYTEVASMEWKDFDDFAKKYSHTENPENAAKRFAVWGYFDGLGYLHSRGVMLPETMFDMTGNNSIALWTKFEPIIYGFRERDGRPETWRWFEYLADEMKKVRHQRGLPEYVAPWKPETVNR